MSLLQGEHQIDGVVSRESAFLANNWLFAGITFAALWGTCFPCLVRSLQAIGLLLPSRGSIKWWGHSSALGAVDGGRTTLGMALYQSRIVASRQFTSPSLLS